MSPKPGRAQVLICGAVAFDISMKVEGRSQDQIQREYGGCAGNIAYNMRFLGDWGAPLASVGTDAAPYVEWMRSHGVPTDRVVTVAGVSTAQIFAGVDQGGNRTIALHPGAMRSSHLNGIGTAPGIELGVVADEGREAMLRHADEFARAGIPFLFDPGRSVETFDGDELRSFVARAAWIAVNEREWNVLRERTAMSEAGVAARVRALVITHGAKGSTIHARGERFAVPPAKPGRVVDSSGCGDAYRAGLLHGLLHALDWPSTGRIASLLGAIKIEARGGQNHRFSRSDFYTRYLQNYGTRLALVRIPA